MHLRKDVKRTVVEGEEGEEQLNLKVIEQPSWFDEQMRSRIPKDMVPTLEQVRMHSSRMIQAVDLELGLGGKQSGFKVTPHDMEPELERSTRISGSLRSKAARELMAVARRGEGRSFKRS